jgi:hypothetical protein
LEQRGRKEREGSRLTRNRVRTLTGKEIELDIEPDYRVCFLTIPHQARGEEIREER